MKALKEKRLEDLFPSSTLKLLASQVPVKRTCSRLDFYFPQSPAISDGVAFNAVAT